MGENDNIKAESLNDNELEDINAGLRGRPDDRNTRITCNTCLKTILVPKSMASVYMLTMKCSCGGTWTPYME